MTRIQTAPAPLPPAAEGITYRLMRDLDDVPGMAAANDANRKANGVLEPTEPAEMRRHYANLVHCVYTRDVVIAEDGDRTVGYARASWNEQQDGSRVHEITLLVDPVAWRRGIADGLLAWAEGHHRRLVAADPVTHPAGRDRWFEVFVFDGDTELTRAVEHARYRVVRRGAEMLRDRLDDELPDVPLPAGFEVRQLDPADLRAFWEVAVDTFADSWGEHVHTETDWERYRDDPRRDLSLFLVAYAGDEIAGWVENILEPQPDGSVRGLLDGVATRAPYRRRGLARALVAKSLRVLRGHGATSAYLGVDLQNPNQALTLYESCGFRVASGGRTYRRPIDGWPEDST